MGNPLLSTVIQQSAEIVLGDHVGQTGEAEVEGMCPEEETKT